MGQVRYKRLSDSSSSVIVSKEVLPNPRGVRGDPGYDESAPVPGNIFDHNNAVGRLAVGADQKPSDACTWGEACARTSAACVTDTVCARDKHPDYYRGRRHPGSA